MKVSDIVSVKIWGIRHQLLFTIFVIFPTYFSLFNSLSKIDIEKAKTIMGKSQKQEKETKEKEVPRNQNNPGSIQQANPGTNDMQLKYSRLKKKYKSLRDEYSKVLESWELGAKSIKSLLDERKFLKKKLDTFFKSQNFIDEQIFKSNLDETKT